MSLYQKIRSEMYQQIKLVLPILVAQISQVMMYFTDTVMAGQVSPTDMAALALANSIWAPMFISVQGFMMALTPIIAKYKGGYQRGQIRPTVQQGILLALLLSVLFILLYRFSPIVFNYLGLEENLKRLTIDYLYYIAWGLPALLVYFTLRSFIEGLSFTKPIMWISFVGLAVNLPANYFFIYGVNVDGYELIPALGGAGCGLATTVVNWVMLGVMLIIIKRTASTRSYYLLSRWQGFQGTVIREIFKIGTPMAFATFFEVSLFSLIPLFISSLGVNVIAGQQTAISITSLVFMIPVSLSMVAVMRVSFFWGRKVLTELKIAIYSTYILGFVFALFTATILFFFRYEIADLYSDDPEVIEIAANIIIFAVIFQLSDAFQVIGNGVLRGLKNTNIIFYLTFIAYWVIGFPIGYSLALTDWLGPPMGAQGFWVGITLGLTFAAISLGWFIPKSLKKITSSMI